MNLNFIIISLFWMTDDITEENYFDNNIDFNPNNNVQLIEVNPNNNQNIEKEFQRISNLINQDQISIKKDYYNRKKISEIYQDCDKLKDSKIGSLNPFKYYIQLSFCCEENYEELLQLYITDLDIYKYRKVKGDGNCFYRSFIFSFIENIILKNDIILMKEIFIKFNNLCENDLSKNYNIDFEEIKAILYIIIDYMQTDNSNSTAFIFFQKAYLFCESLDTGIVLFMRYLMKEYLSSIEDQYYNNNIEVPIGSLLPDEYIKGDNYLFDEYYKNNLMKMNEFAENIVVLNAPFALNCELNIFELKYEYNSKIKRIFCHKRDPINPKEEDQRFIRINLIYNSEIMHYELGYTKSFYEENYNYLLDLTNSISTIFSNNEALERQISKLYIRYLNIKNPSNFTGDFLEYLKSYSFFSKILLTDDKKKLEDINKKVEDLINKEKNVCIKCFNTDFKKAYFEFYCGCKICKEECFNKYIEPDEDDENKIYYDYFTKCLWGEEFNKKKVEEYLKNHENKDKEKYDLLIQSHWKWRCMVCNDTFNRRFRYYRLIFKEKCEFTNKNLEHLICFNCKKNNKGKEAIKCKFCGISHTIKSIRNVDEDNKNEPICMII